MANDFESKRIDKMVKVLNDLSDDDLMSLFYDANSYKKGEIYCIAKVRKPNSNRYIWLLDDGRYAV